jgi:hypothetical protein
VDTVAQAVEVEEIQKQQQLAQQPASAGAPKEKGDKKKDKGKGKKPAKLAGIADLNKDNSGKIRCESTVVVYMCYAVWLAYQQQRYKCGFPNRCKPVSSV